MTRRLELHADVSKVKGISQLGNERPWRTTYMRLERTMRTVGVNYYATHAEALDAANAWARQGVHPFWRFGA